MIMLDPAIPTSTTYCNNTHFIITYTATMYKTNHVQKNNRTKHQNKTNQATIQSINSEQYNSPNHQFTLTQTKLQPIHQTIYVRKQKITFQPKSFQQHYPPQY